VASFVAPCLTYVDITPRVDSQGVCVCQLTHLMSGTAKIRHNLAATVIEDFHFLIIFIYDKHKPLLSIGRKAYPLGRAPRPRHVPGPRIVLAPLLISDKYVFLKLSHLIEYLNPIVESVAYVNQAVISNRHTMRYISERGAITGIPFGLRVL
jgi:hypothetical protein